MKLDTFFDFKLGLGSGENREIALTWDAPKSTPYVLRGQGNHPLSPNVRRGRVPDGAGEDAMLRLLIGL